MALMPAYPSQDKKEDANRSEDVEEGPPLRPRMRVTKTRQGGQRGKDPSHGLERDRHTKAGALWVHLVLYLLVGSSPVTLGAVRY